MTILISHIFLQHYWWIIISLIAGLLVFLMFVQGGQSLIFFLPENTLQKTIIINAMGRKWEFTFTTLVTFGGAFFASFPLFYATSFGGAYWVWISILFSFIIQAVAYEFRSKPANILGQKTYDIFLFLNGSLGPFLIGTTVATFFTGSQFRLNDMNQVQWATSWHGLEALFEIRNLALGIAVLFLARLNGLLYLINTVENDEIGKRAVRFLLMNSAVFLAAFLFFILAILLSEGMALNTVSGKITIEKYKYLSNFIEMPLVMILFLSGVVSVLYSIWISLYKKSRIGIWFSGAGTIIAVFSLFLTAGFNGTPFYPSAFDLQSSLTIYNASSSPFTLKTMMYVSIIIPLVIGYVWYAWKAINNNRISEDELKEDGHVY
jgi:cytochrome bd ubiquinol oxidase subunit II